MTVEELEKVFSEVKDKKRTVIMEGYYDTEVNGWYMDTRDGKDVLILSRYNVQPRINPET